MVCYVFTVSSNKFHNLHQDILTITLSKIFQFPQNAESCIFEAVVQRGLMGFYIATKVG